MGWMTRLGKELFRFSKFVALAVSAASGVYAALQNEGRNGS